MKSSTRHTGAKPTSDEYRLLFESVPDPCLVLDPEFRIVAVNQAYLEATLTRYENLVGHQMFEVFPDNPGDPGATGVRNLRASLERVRKRRLRDVMAVQKYDIWNGAQFEIRYWSPINTPALDADGALLYIIHRVQDVTDFVLRQQVLLDPSAPGVKMDAETYNSARAVAETNLRLKQAIDELEGKNRELLDLNVRLAHEAAARKEAEDALHQANDDLQRSNKSLELFASVASHDLQEPLHTITSYTELLARRYLDKLDAKGQQYVEFILDGTNHMHMMINDLLAYSRVSSKSKPLVPVDLNPVLDKVIGSLRQAITRGKATIDRPPLPHVEGDEIQLAQLFQNLIGNALKFAKKGTPPVIRITCEPCEDGWLIGIHDNGIGIEERFFEKIFEIFRRLHTRQEYEGTGIGLAICKRIIEHHGGRIWAESTFGEGSTFCFTLRGIRHEK